MSNENMQTTIENERLIFKSRGLPKGTEIKFFILGIAFIIISIIGIKYTSTLSVYDSFDNTGIKTDTYMSDEGDLVTSIKTYSVYSEKTIQKFIITFVIIMVLGILSIMSIVLGRKIYLKIYDTHIEGHTGIGILGKDIHIPIKQICEISSKLKGTSFPAIVIRTIYGSKFSIVMSKNNITKAENILRDIIEKYQE